MEVGKLALSGPAPSSSSPASTAGCIFYFILDEDYPDEPREGHQRYFYVLSAVESYTQAYHFLCRSLCTSSSATRRLSATSATDDDDDDDDSGEIDSDSQQSDNEQNVIQGTYADGRLRRRHAESPFDGARGARSAHANGLDRNSVKLRQWYQLYVRVFGTETYDRFVDLVCAAPRKRVSRHGSGLHDPTALPIVFVDEASARLALANYRQALEEEAAPLRQVCGRLNGSPRPMTDDDSADRLVKTAMRNRQQASARLQNSCTPAKQADAKAPTARPSTAPLQTLTFQVQHSPDVAGRQALVHQQRQAERPAPPPPKLSNQAMSVSALLTESPIQQREPSAVARENGHARGKTVADGSIGKARTATAAATAVAGTTTLHPQRLSGGATSAATPPHEMAAVTEWKQLLQHHQARHEIETARLRSELQALRETLQTERQSRGRDVEEAVEQERKLARASAVVAEKQHRAEVRILDDRVRAKNEDVEALQTALDREQEVAAEQAAQLRTENRQLQEKVRLLGREHGERLHSVVRENQVAMDKLDARALEKERELRNLYDDAIQSRDIKIAELTQGLLKMEHALRYATSKPSAAPSEERLGLTADRKSASRPSSGDLRTVSAEPSRRSPSPPLREAYSTERAVSYSHRINDVDERVSVSMPAVANGYVNEGPLLLSERCTELESTVLRLSCEKRSLEVEIIRRDEQLASLQAQLSGATGLIQSLKHGLETVQNELPVLQREMMVQTRVA